MHSENTYNNQKAYLFKGKMIMQAIVNIDITRALAIDGFMEEQELVWLAQQAKIHKCIVEIGSLLGRSTRALLDHTEGIVYAFDDWKGPRDMYMSKDDRLNLFT